MEKARKGNKLALLGIVAVSAGFVGSSFAASDSSRSGVTNLVAPTQIASIRAADFELPPDVLPPTVDEIARVVRNMVQDPPDCSPVNPGVGPVAAF